MQYSKRLILALLYFFSSFLTLSAQDITGLWKGYMYNDTTQKNYKYEIAISENHGKLTGYSHTYFIIDDKEYHGLKRLKIHRQDDKIIVQDVELVSHNYPIEPPKGVHQLNMLTLQIKDTVMILSGMFTTNHTREYHPVTGFIHVERKKNYSQSALLPLLDELGLTKNLSFMEPDKQENLVAIQKAQVETTKGQMHRKNDPTLQNNNARPVVINTPIEKIKPIVVEPVVSTPAADVNNRKIQTIESVYFRSDSLVLSLFDNGEVDGDTVSVLMNGKVIMPMVGLSTKAVRKTIYITKDMPDSILLVMYAENLGSIPPNTGLLVVRDGESSYDIFFTGDMQKNAAILLRRKKDK